MHASLTFVKHIRWERRCDQREAEVRIARLRGRGRGRARGGGHNRGKGVLCIIYFP
jgi:hypothetical protein